MTHTSTATPVSPERILQTGLGFWASKTLLSASPFVLTYAYLRAFKTGRRPYFDRDLYFYFINGRGVSPAPPNRQPIHPVLGRKTRPGRD